jgi:hypothetical protein
VQQPVNYTNMGVPVSDVTGQLSISGKFFGLPNHKVEEIVTLTNIGPTPIIGPLSLVLDYLNAGDVLPSPTGITVKNKPVGSPYVDVLPPNGFLGIGQSVQLFLFFQDPLSVPILYNSRVLAGSGQR